MGCSYFPLGNRFTLNFHIERLEWNGNGFNYFLLLIHTIHARNPIQCEIKLIRSDEHRFDSTKMNNSVISAILRSLAVIDVNHIQVKWNGQRVHSGRKWTATTYVKHFQAHPLSFIELHIKSLHTIIIHRYSHNQIK